MKPSNIDRIREKMRNLQRKQNNDNIELQDNLI